MQELEPEQVRERILEAIGDDWPPPWATGEAVQDDQLADEAMIFLRDLAPQANVLGTHLDLHEKFGVVMRIDYTEPGDGDPARLTIWRDVESGTLGTVSCMSFDGGPLPGCDYPLTSD
jgi:hypothetical protein